MAGEAGKGRRFDRDFKIRAVKLITEEGQSGAEVTRSLGIHPNQLYSWKKFSDGGDKAFPGKGYLTELSALRKQLRDVTLESDILKKCSAYFQNRPEAIRLHN